MQFVLAAVLLLSANWQPLPWTVFAMAFPGVLLAVSAWFAIGLRNIRVHPSTTCQTKFVSNGPYRVVRHPMYTGLIWCTAVFLPSGFAWWRIFAWLALVIVLRTKAGYEEVAMSEQFEDYSEYRKQVGRLVPKLWS
jgi:protein-S-isoprenylcysteine O-methyltransferase Ste14